MKKVLITGSAGFIGYHLAKKMLLNGFHVIGVDNLNSYYDPLLKETRLNELDKFIKKNTSKKKYNFHKIDISNNNKISNLFKKYDFDIVINLAAQAGVRYSLKNPKTYVKSNLVGFANLLECCRHSNIKHLLFASSSSVYGMNKDSPFRTRDNTDFPVSLYAATKKSNELLAFSYSHLYDMPTTGLRFFTVYGPYGRPDMAYFSFTKAIDNGETIDVYNSGNMMRDFTYIDDIVEGIIKLVDKTPEPKSNATSNAKAPYRVVNIGNNKPISLKRFIQAIENSLDKKAKIRNLPMQAGDVKLTFADIKPLSKITGFKPNTSIEEGIDNFVKWYKSKKT